MGLLFPTMKTPRFPGVEEKRQSPHPIGTAPEPQNGATMGIIVAGKYRIQKGIGRKRTQRPQRGRPQPKRS